MITTYKLEELLGTKLRALYQRKKGRDLFDLSIALKQFPSLEISKLVDCFNHYIAINKNKISPIEFEINLSEKINDRAFIEDIKPLLPHDISVTYNPVAETNFLKKIVIHLAIGKKRIKNNEFATI